MRPPRQDQTYNNQLNGGPLAGDCNDDGYNDSDSDDNGDGEGYGNSGGTRCNDNKDNDNNNHALPVVVDVIAIQRLRLCRAGTTMAAAG